MANPIPDAQAIEACIADAVIWAEREGIARKALTPYLLQRIVELTEERSLSANVALVLNNAAVAAQLAVALVTLL